MVVGTSGLALLSNQENFCTDYTEFDSGEIWGRAQSLEHNGHPSAVTDTRLDSDSTDRAFGFGTWDEQVLLLCASNYPVFLNENTSLKSWWDES